MRVRVLPGVPISRACGLTRTAEGPDSDSGSLGGASPFMPTISRRLASAGTADPGDLKSPSLPGASPGSPTGVWFTGNSRPVRLKIEQPWECKSPHADQFGMSTGRADRACLLNSVLLETGVWCESTAFRQPFKAANIVRSVQRQPYKRHRTSQR